MTGQLSKYVKVPTAVPSLTSKSWDIGTEEGSGMRARNDTEDKKKKKRGQVI